MIYIFLDYDSVERVYEGPDMDLNALLSAFDKEFYGVEPFVAPTTKCNIQAWSDRCHCQGTTCMYEWRAATSKWVNKAAETRKEARKRGVSKQFHEWLVEQHQLTPVSFKTVET